MSLLLQLFTSLMALAASLTCAVNPAATKAERASVAQAALVAASGVSSTSPHRVTAN